MKKIKIMLTAITVLAVVGGALAFKATKFSQGNIYCSTFTGADNCKLVNFTTTLPAPLPASITNPCGDIAGTPSLYFTQDNCPVATTTTVYANPE